MSTDSSEITKSRSQHSATRGAVLSLVLVLAVLSVSAVALYQLRHAYDPILEVRRATVSALFGGLVAASFVEIVKRATSFRGWFQRRALRIYFGNDPVEDPGASRRLSQTPSALEKSLPSRNALYYSVSPDQFSAQLSELGERAIAKPQDNQDLLGTLLGSQEGVSEYASNVESWTPPVPPAATGEEPPPLEADAPTVTLAVQSAELRGKLEARIDAFQVSVAAQWSLILRLTAGVLSALAAGLIAAGVGLGGAGIWTAIAAGLTIGTVVAWVTNDILNIIRRFGG